MQGMDGPLKQPIVSTASLLKGELKKHSSTTQYLRLHLLKLPDPHCAIMPEIFQLKSPEFDNWEAEDWLCTDCVKKLLSAHLHLWLLEQKRKDGETIPNDCWYGYNCRTQIHKVAHAQQLNHLCEPKR